MIHYIRTLRPLDLLMLNQQQASIQFMLLGRVL